MYVSFLDTNQVQEKDLNRYGYASSHLVPIFYWSMYSLLKVVVAKKGCLSKEGSSLEQWIRGLSKDGRRTCLSKEGSRLEQWIRGLSMDGRRTRQ